MSTLHTEVSHPATLALLVQPSCIGSGLAGASVAGPGWAEAEKEFRR